MAYNFDKVGEYAPKINEVISFGYFDENYLAKIGKVYQNIVKGDKVSRTISNGWKGAVADSCEREYLSTNLLADAEWDVANAFLGYKICYEDIEAEFKRANPVGEGILGNDPIEKLFTDQLTDNFNQSVLALSLFGTKGSTTDGLGLIDGIFTQMMTLAQTDSDRLTAFGTQTKAYARTNTNAVDAVLEMIDDASVELKGAKNRVIVMTDALWRAIQFNKRVAGGQVVTSDAYVDLIGGIKQYDFDGIPVLVSPIFDSIIAGMASGQDTLAGKPYFAALVNTDAIAFGSTGDREIGVGKVKLFNEDKENSTYGQISYSIGALVLDPKMFQILA